MGNIDCFLVACCMRRGCVASSHRQARSCHVMHVLWMQATTHPILFRTRSSCNFHTYYYFLFAILQSATSFYNFNAIYLTNYVFANLGFQLQHFTALVVEIQQTYILHLHVRNSTKIMVVREELLLFKFHSLKSRPSKIAHFNLYNPYRFSKYSLNSCSAWFALF